jgi:hypothetical protein
MERLFIIEDVILQLQMGDYQQQMSIKSMQTP